MLHVFIVNPAAKAIGSRSRLADLEEAIRARRLEYQIVVSERPGHATELAHKAVARGAGAVVAVGGDGLINEVLNGIDGHTRLGIVPVGTCNDVAWCVGVPCGDWRAALDVIAAGEVRRVDVARCGDRRFLSVAGAGLDSRVALVHQRLPRLLRGRAAYTTLVLGKLLAGRPATFRIAIDGEQIERRAWMVAVANMERYAGGMRIAPEARPDDGRLHVCIVGDGSRLEFIRAFPRVFRGTHTSHPMISTFEAKAIYLSCDEPTPIIADGEHVGWLPTTLAIEPRAVALLSPQGAGQH